MDRSRGLESQVAAENTRACTALLDSALGHFSHVARLHQLPSSLCHQLPASRTANVLNCDDNVQTDIYFSI